jgi:hypothetical protein
MPLGSVVVVPFARPASIPPLIGVAATIAAADDGHVVPVIAVPRNAPDEERAAAAAHVVEAERLARRHGVAAAGLVVETDDVPGGIRSLVDAQHGSLVVMGWRGPATGDNVFGRLVDELIGRTSVPLALLRAGPVTPDGVVLAIGSDHLAAGGRGGVALATQLARALSATSQRPVTLVEAGTDTATVPDDTRRTADRLHVDPRPLRDAVAAASHRGDIVVTPVAPTLRGLREAAINLAWAAPQAALLVALDAGAPADRGLATAVTSRPTQVEDPDVPIPVRVEVSVVAPPRQRIRARVLHRALRLLGDVDEVDVWWEAARDRQHLRTAVRLHALGVNTAVGAVMIACHETDELAGCDLKYDVLPDVTIPVVPDLTVMGSAVDEFP